MALEDDVLHYIDRAAEQKPAKQQTIEPFSAYYKRRVGNERLLPEEYNKIVNDYSNDFADAYVKQTVGNRPSRGVQQYDEAVAAARSEWQSSVSRLLPLKKSDTTTDTVKNYAKTMGATIVGTAKNIGELTGGGSVTDYLDKTSKNLSENKTETSRIGAQRQQEARDYAKNSGSFMAEIGTNIRTVRGEDVASGIGFLLPVFFMVAAFSYVKKVLVNRWNIFAFDSSPEKNEISLNLDNAEQINNFWAIALAEFDSPERQAGLWARLFTEAQGNENLAKANYLQTRVAQMQQV